MSSIRPAYALALLAIGCKSHSQSCSPVDEARTSFVVVVSGESNINPSDEGNALPTELKVIQLSGTFLPEEVTFEALWGEDVQTPLQPITLETHATVVYPGQTQDWILPLHPDARIILTAAFVRKPLASSWYGSFVTPNTKGTCQAPASTVCMATTLDRYALRVAGPSPADATRLACAAWDAQPVKKHRRLNKRIPAAAPPTFELPTPAIPQGAP